MVRLRRILIALLIVALALAGLWFFGPREPVDLAVTFDPAEIGADPESYLKREEADIPNLRLEAQKQIVWAYPASRAKTPLAIVYIHGFSASKAELRPLPDEIAGALHANLFFTRLDGHGRDGPGLAITDVNAWVNDLAEALAIADRIGEKTVIVANSTGAALATLGATVPGLMKNVQGLVLMSPNYRLQDWRAPLLTFPFARKLVPLFGSETTAAATSNPEIEKHWTRSFPTVSYLPMAALAKAARSADVSTIRIPAFFLFSPEDRVIDPNAVRAVASRWGAPAETMEVTGDSDPAHHVLAGDIISPATTDALAARIVDWIRSLPTN
ncbi:alpha/beta hydrolase [Consotaella salsifontis]|uniref:Esterase/lipase n=1 Tax=Consotaella salsifontis TaxID=1365950 RepID=A0A1T4LCR4_9HYPH|nr:alpha/beta fold hydrolase [Consotaella salsifontis]SJZ52480.1 Esterase/lipase [Consotaella salsifontis]